MSRPVTGTDTGSPSSIKSSGQRRKAFLSDVLSAGNSSEASPASARSRAKSRGDVTSPRAGAKASKLPKKWRDFYVGRLLDRNGQQGMVQNVHITKFGEGGKNKLTRDYVVVWSGPDGEEAREIMPEAAVKPLALDTFATEPWVLPEVVALQAADWDAAKARLPSPSPSKKKAAPSKRAAGPSAAGSKPPAKKARKPAAKAAAIGKAIAAAQPSAAKAPVERASAGKAASSGAKAGSSKSASKSAAGKAQDKPGKALEEGATYRAFEDKGEAYREYKDKGGKKRKYPERLCFCPGDRRLSDYQGAEEEEDQDYVVQWILDERKDADGDREYLLKWEGYELDPNKWEPEEIIESNVALDVWIKNRRRLRV